MYYAPYVMDRVVNYRERVTNLEVCTDCIGRVALLRAGDIGRRVWIQAGDGAVEGPYYVTDVAARHDIPALLRRGQCRESSPRPRGPASGAGGLHPATSAANVPDR